MEGNPFLSPVGREKKKVARVLLWIQTITGIRRRIRHQALHGAHRFLASMLFSAQIARRRLLIGAMAGLACVAPHASALDGATQSPPNAGEVLARYLPAASPEARNASQQDDTSDEVGVRAATNGDAVTPSRPWRTIVRELVIAGPARLAERRPARRLRLSNLTNAPDPHVEAARGLYGSHAPAGS